MNANAPNGNPANPSNGRAAILTTLAASGNKAVQSGTLALVAISGVTSFLQSLEISKDGHHERERAIKEIHALYGKLEETEQRQLKALANQRELIESNVKQVHNQTEMLDNQQKMLNLVRRTQKIYLRKNGVDLDSAPDSFEPGGP